MTKKPRQPATLQERMVAKFAELSISSRNTFHPNIWKKTGHEPADMLIVVGRAVLFINMTSGKSYFDDLVAHNLRQARDRMVEWAEGLSIKGGNQWRTFNIAWSDVDLAVISVVDGPHAGCAYHNVAELNFDAKVRLCSTVTGEVMFELATKGGGARDLLQFCQSMWLSSRMSPADGILRLHQQYNYIRAPREASAKIPKLVGPALIQGKQVSLFDEFKWTFILVRRSGIDAEAFSDLNWVDVLDAAAFFANSIAEMEGLPNGQVRYTTFGHLTRFTLIVSTSHDGLMKSFPAIQAQSTADRACMWFTVSLTSLGPMSTLAFLGGTGARETEAFLSAL